VSSKAADFNYKVALASGLKSLQGGRLRQAEEQFRYLMKHFPGADGGYRGLAKVLVEQEDRPGALKILLDGGAGLAKAGARAAAIALYREATMLDPKDLTAHRRLAAALALAGEPDEAAHEYARYVSVAMAAGDDERAKNVATYALERLPDNHEVAEAARRAGVVVPEPVMHARIDAPVGDDLMRQTYSVAPVAKPKPIAPLEQVAPIPMPEFDVAEKPSAAAPPPPKREVAKDWSAQPPPSADIWTPSPPSTHTFAEPISPDDPWAPSGPLPPLDLTNDDEQTVEATAARYLAKGDPRGGEAALEAARRYIADGRVDAASDLLLQLIGAGIANHEAQRLLVEVTTSLGKTEVAKMKVKLLVQALRLGGHTELAAEVEQLAAAF